MTASWTTRDRRGYSLIELIVYLGVYATLLGLALLCFYKCCDHYFDLKRRSDDITRALRAGEVWRQDVRTATGAVRVSEKDQILHIPHQDGEISYRFAETTVYRQAKAEAPWTVMLARVQSSAMQSDTRTHVAAWRWEVELTTKNATSRIRPVFTFLAATSTTTTP